MINTILILVLLAQPVASVDKDMETRVLDGRKLVERYRDAWLEVKSEHDRCALMEKLVWSLEQAGYTSDSPRTYKQFSDESDDYNAIQLGYKDAKDLLEKDDPGSCADLVDMWK